ncbi:sensor histidine kinase [Haloactinospora alba]|nr:histidine kinase [Haloactinospora alba]
MLSYAGLNGSIAPLLTFQVLFVQPALYPIAGYMGSRLRTIFSDLAAEQEARQQAERDTAAAEERARLARDMHDSVAKTLRGTAMAAQALPLWVRRDPDRADNEAARIAKAAQTAADEARDLISDLRTNRSEDDLATEVSEIVRCWSEETGVPANISVPSPTDTQVRLLVVAKQETLAILNEALANIDRHAGAGSIDVALRAGEDGYAVLHIADSGVGFGPFTWDSTSHSIRDLPEPTGHYGLLGMWERAQHAGGSLRIESTPGEGTSTTLRMPMAASITTSATSNADTVETA